MNPPARPADEEQRIRALCRYELDSSQIDPALDELTVLAARICETPISLISIVEENRQWFRSRAGTTLGETPRAVSFCGHAILQPGVMVVPDSQQDARFADNPLVTGHPFVRFYAGAPLVTSDGHALGALSVVDHVPRTLSPAQIEALRVLAGQVMSRLELARQTRELRESERVLSTLISNLPGMAYRGLADANRTVTFVSEGCLQVTGYTREELESNRAVACGNLIHPGDRARVQAALEQALGARERCSLEYRILARDGSVRWVWERATGIYAEDGTWTGVEGFVQDITERKRADGALVASEQRFHFAMEATRDGIWDWNIASGHVYFSPQWARLLGYAPDEVPQQVGFFFSVLHPDDIPRVNHLVAEHMAGRTPVKQDEVRLKMKSGEYRWFFDRGKVVAWDEAGQPARMVGTITDITERKQAEAALRESERELRLITNQVPGPVSRVDRNLRYLFVNDHYEAAFGIPRERMLGLTIPEVVGPERFQSVAPYVERVLRGEFVTFESKDCLPSRQENYCLVSCVPDFDAERNVVGFIMVAIDITERRKAEAALRVSDVALKAISQGVLITDAGGLILSVNQAFSSITGYAPEDVLGRDCSFLRARLADTRAAEAMRRARDQGLEVALEAMDQRKDGSPYWNELTVTPVRDEHGKVTHSIAVIRDITERRQLEQQIRQTHKMDAIGQLASGVAHDFNNILGAILGNVELALPETSPTHPARECLDEVKRSTLRAKSLIQQILAFSRQQPQERRVTALAPVLQESIKLLRATLPAAVEVAAVLDPAAPLVLADPTEMHQVLVNLCTNAWHALEDRPGRIDIRLEEVTIDAFGAGRLAGLRPGRCARLTVRDTGKGMSPEILSRIFDPFFTTKEPGKGTGLGLSVVHGIVHGHDGVITVESQPGKGSTFEIYLPAASGVEEVATPKAPAIPRGNGQSILYLDDEKALVTIAVRMLERLGYRARGFTVASEAIQAFSEAPTSFDIVITDMNMPRTSGLQVASELFKMRPGMPVVLSSGRVTEELRQQARVAGICDVLHKPSTMEELNELIRRVTGAETPAVG